jgi:hypothetical protein
MAETYEAYGLAIASTLPLPLTTVRSGPVDVRVSIELAEGAVAGGGFVRQDDPDDPWIIEHWQRHQVLLTFPVGASFEVARDRVIVRSDTLGDVEMLAHLILDHVLPRVVALRGDLVLHASGAIGPSGLAHLFVGSTGLGKSTLATALGRKGWALIDDDIVRVQLGPRGAWALPGYPGVRLLPDAAASVLPPGAAGTPMARDHPKRRYATSKAVLRNARRASRIANVFVLERTQSTTASTSAITFGESVAELTRNSLFLHDPPDAITRVAFERVTELLGSVSSARLHHPEGLANLASTIELLRLLDETLPRADEGDGAR